MNIDTELINKDITCLDDVLKDIVLTDSDRHNLCLWINKVSYIEYKKGHTDGYNSFRDDLKCLLDIT